MMLKRTEKLPKRRGDKQMPVKETKITSGKNKGKYSVKTPNSIHAKATTKAKADAQVRLLNAVDHGWKPTGAPAKKTTPKPMSKRKR